MFGVLQRGGEIRANVVGNVKMRVIEKQIVEHVKIGSQLFTDDFSSYDRIGKLYPHEKIRHSLKEYTRGGSAYKLRRELLGALQTRIYRNLPLDEQ